MQKTYRLEKHLEKAICDYCKGRGWLVYKFKSPSNRGVADRIIITSIGTVVFLEVKKKGSKPTSLQTKFIMDVTDRSGNADWKDDLEKAKQYLDECDKANAQRFLS